MNRIVFIANRYPNNVDINGLVFVQQLVWSIADQGIDCTVICPLAINLNLNYKKVQYHIVEETEKGNNVNVFFPKFFGLGQSHYLFGKSPAPLTTNMFYHSVENTIRRNEISFEAAYGHFITPAGICAARIGKKYKVPSFVAYGESNSWSIDQFGESGVRKELESVSGIIAVSTKNKDLLLEKRIVPSDRIKVFPNGFRSERFYPMEKSTARNHFGWNQEQYIVGMVGSLIERKGPNRLKEAVEKLQNVYFVCAGKGNQIPDSTRCLFCGPIENEELVFFYNALDAFVLPTLDEGCCNAIVEAIACGCPIISSNKTFNYDICDATNSILVDPENIDEISKAISTVLQNDEVKAKLGMGSVIRSKELTLENRAKAIIQFIDQSLS